MASQKTAPAPITEEYPLEPGMTACMVTSFRYEIVSSTVLSFGLAGGFYLIAAVGLAARGAGPELFLYVGALFLGVATLTWAFFWRRLIDYFRDVRQATYIRTTGPIRVLHWVPYEGYADMYHLKLFDREFDTSAKISDMPWGTVGYSKHAHVIFEVRDAEGRVVYQNGDWHALR